MKKLDLTGNTSFYLTAIEESGKRGKSTMWRCRCKCGKITSVAVDAFTGGNVKSCGCWIKSHPSNRKHGMRYTPEYDTWRNMRRRCCIKNNKRNKNYGGRGITVCDRWEHSFENFYADMGKRPDGRYSIDRINNDGNYTPENCRWATDKEQQRHTTRSRMVEYKGLKCTLVELCEELNLGYAFINKRINRDGMTIKEAIETPRRVRR